MIPLAEDIPLYKKYIEDRFLHVTSIAHDKLVNHDANLAQLQGSIDVAGRNFDAAGDKFRAIENAMHRLNESMQLLLVQMASVGDSVRNPQQFSLGTPHQPQQQRQPQRPHNDDQPSAGQPTMGAPGFSSLYLNLLPRPSMPGNMPRYDYPQAEAQPVRPNGIPASFGEPTPQPAIQSPSDEDAFGTPNQMPTSLFGAGGSGDFRATHAHHQSHDGRCNVYDRFLQYASVQQHPSSWEPSYKDNKDLMKFDATINSYVDWSQSILDHLSRTNRG